MTMKLAALDVGSNTVLMLVVERAADGTPCPLAEMARITRLGRRVDLSGRLDPDAAAETLDTIAEFAAKARALGADRIVAAATAALRDAADGAEFIARTAERTGVKLEIISGQAEARLCYLATRHGLKLAPATSLLIVDIGGGSTELIRAQPGAELKAVSLQIGSVRLTERHVHHDPPSAGELEELKAAVDAVLRDLGWRYRPEAMVAVAGTVTTICAIALGLEQYSAAAVHGHRLASDQLKTIIGGLSTIPLEQRKRVRGMEPGRADVLLAGALILQRVMEYFGLDQVTVSEQGVRWGLVWREFEQLSASR